MPDRLPPNLKVGDRVPMPPRPTIKVRPMSHVDGPKNGPRGVFRNGRGSSA